MHVLARPGTAHAAGPIGIVLVVVASTATTFGCLDDPARGGVSIRLPTQVAALAPADCAALEATIAVRVKESGATGAADPGRPLLTEEQLQVVGCETLEGDFVLPKVEARVRGAFTIQLRYAPEAAGDALLAVLEGELDIVPNADNSLGRVGAFETCGAATPGGACAFPFDLNRNQRSNLDDLVAGINPLPPSPFVDVAPSTLVFRSNIALGDYARDVIIVRNPSDEPVDVQLSVVDGPGVTLSPVEVIYDDPASEQRALRLPTMAPYEERFVAVAFAPVNAFLTVGDVYVEATNPRTQVTQAVHVRVLGNPEGIPQPELAGYGELALEPADVELGASVPIEVFPAAPLFSGLPVKQARLDAQARSGLAYVGQSLSARFLEPDPTTAAEDDVREVQAIVPADHAFLLAIPAAHKLSVSLAGLESDVDLAVFMLDANDAISDDARRNRRRALPGPSPEAVELENTTGAPARALVVLGRVEDAPPPQVPGGIAPTALAPFELSAHVTSAPELRSVTPARGPREGGTRVRLVGRRFHPQATVTIGGAPASECEHFVEGDVTVLDCSTPESFGAGRQAANVVVSNPGVDEGGDGQAATLPTAFLYDAPKPRLEAIEPAVATAGTPVTLRGAFFSTRVGLPRVFFDDVEAAAVTFVDATELRAVVPPHPPGIATVTVRNVLEPDLSVGDDQRLSPPSDVRTFSYIAPAVNPPVVERVANDPSPDPGLPAETSARGSIDGGDPVIIAGTGFVPAGPGAFASTSTFVLFGDALAAEVVVESATRIRCTTPPQANPGLVPVRVINPDGQPSDGAQGFEYLVPPPSVVSVYPAVGVTTGGSFVLIAGAGFRAGPLQNGSSVSPTVTFVRGAERGVSLSVTPLDSGTLLVATPAVAGSGAYDITVANPDGQSVTLGGAFTMERPAGPPPEIRSITPDSGAQNVTNAVTITGVHFRNPSVIVGAARARVTFWTDTDTVDTLGVAIPASDTAGPAVVRVINDDGQGDETRFNLLPVRNPPPALELVSPARAGAGALLTIRGRDFDFPANAAGQSARVLVGGRVVAPESASRGEVAVRVPTLDPVVRGDGALVAVELTNIDGQSTSATFEYLVAEGPRIHAVRPLVAAPGSEVTVTGEGFDVASVSVGGDQLDASAFRASPVSVDFTMPAPAGSLPALVTVELINVDGSKAMTTVAVDVAVVDEEGVDQEVVDQEVVDQEVVDQEVVDQEVVDQEGGVAPAGAPRIDEIAPASSPTAGGRTITLTGAGFSLGGTLEVGGVEVVPTTRTATSMTFISLARTAAGLVGVRYTNPDGQSDTILLNYESDESTAPRVSSIHPSEARVNGTVTLSGSNFNLASLEVGTTSIPADSPSIVAKTATTISFVMPALGVSLPSVVALQVVNVDGQRASAAMGVSEDNAPPAVSTPVTIASVTPAQWLIGSNVPVSVAATGLSTGSQLRVNGVTVASSVVNLSRVEFTPTITQPGLYMLTVINGSGGSDDTFLQVVAPMTSDVPPPPPIPATPEPIFATEQCVVQSVGLAYGRAKGGLVALESEIGGQSGSPGRVFAQRSAGLLSVEATFDRAPQIYSSPGDGVFRTRAGTQSLWVLGSSILPGSADFTPIEQADARFVINAVQRLPLDTAGPSNEFQMGSEIHLLLEPPLPLTDGMRQPLSLAVDFQYKHAVFSGDSFLLLYLATSTQAGQWYRLDMDTNGGANEVLVQELPATAPPPHLVTCETWATWGTATETLSREPVVDYPGVGGILRFNLIAGSVTRISPPMDTRRICSITTLDNGGSPRWFFSRQASTSLEDPAGDLLGSCPLVGACGDQICDPGETGDVCPNDCPSTCNGSVCQETSVLGS